MPSLLIWFKRRSNACKFGRSTLFSILAEHGCGWYLHPFREPCMMTAVVVRGLLRLVTASYQAADAVTDLAEAWADLQSHQHLRTIPERDTDRHGLTRRFDLFEISCRAS